MGRLARLGHALMSQNRARWAPMKRTDEFFFLTPPQSEAITRAIGLKPLMPGAIFDISASHGGPPAKVLFLWSGHCTDACAGLWRNRAPSHLPAVFQPAAAFGATQTMFGWDP